MKLRASTATFGLFLVSCAISLVAADVFLLWANPYQHLRPEDFIEKIRREAATRAGRAFDERDPRELARDETRAGRPTERGFYPWRYPLLVPTATIAPLSSLSRSRTVSCNESGVWETIDTDEYGFNNPLGSFGRAPVDLLLIGDSYLEGYCVPARQQIASILRESGFAVINTGQAGNDPALELAALSEYGPKSGASIVLWFYFEKNDLPFGSKEGWSARESLGSPILSRYLDDPDFSQNLFERQAEVDAAVRRAQAITATERAHVDRELPEWVHVTRLIHLRSRLRGLFSGPRIQAQDVAPLGRILGRAEEISSRMGARLWFVYLPAAESLLELRGPGSVVFRPGSELSRRRVPARSRFQRDEVLAVVKARGLPIIDLFPIFAAHADPSSLFPFGGDGHYVAEGHELVAREVVRRLRDDRPANRSTLP